MESKKEIRIGAILSYTLLILNTLYGLIIAPFILKQVGEETYGVYKTVASLSASLAVADLGLSSTMTRYIARFNVGGDKQKTNNFIGMMLIQCIVIAFLFLIASFVFYTQIGLIYRSTFNDAQQSTAKSVLIVLMVSMVIRLFENLLFGIISGSERFSFGNSVKIISLLAKVGLIFVLLPLTKNIIVVVLAEASVALLSVAVFFVYSKARLSLYPKLIRWDMGLFKESFFYTILMLAQTITIQFNGNVDNIIIGATIGATAVTVYSMALIIFNMYENLAGSISNLMLPSITKKVVNNVGYFELEEEIIKVGRIQFFVLGAALGGFIVFGRDFFNVWLGEGYDDCYSLTIILMVAVTFPIVESVALSILRAENKMVFRTVALLISCLINIIITIIGIHFFGYFGAVFGTAMSKAVGLVIMNIYYKKRYGFRILHMFSNIMLKTSFCILLTVLLTFNTKLHFSNNVVSLVFGGLVFVVIYGVLLFSICLQKKERKYIFCLFRSRRKKE